MKLRKRIIPVLLLSDGYLVKPTKFQKPQYIGDPINAVRIFNEKEVDELILLDIDATPKRKPINFQLLEEIVSEAFMPIGYGGGIQSLADSLRLISLGIEKVALNSAAVEHPQLITEISTTIGSQSTIVSIDAKKKFRGYEVLTHSGKKSTHLDPISWAKQVSELGAGEIIATAISKESTFEGYDLQLISEIANHVSIPVVALGGAKTPADLQAAFDAGASAAAAGSMFVLNGPHRAVLITYPKFLPAS